MGCWIECQNVNGQLVYLNMDRAIRMHREPGEQHSPAKTMVRFGESLGFQYVKDTPEELLAKVPINLP
jgi:hypothetical protein